MAESLLTFNRRKDQMDRITSPCAMLQHSLVADLVPVVVIFNVMQAPGDMGWLVQMASAYEDIKRSWTHDSISENVTHIIDNTRFFFSSCFFLVQPRYFRFIQVLISLQNLQSRCLGGWV